MAVAAGMPEVLAFATRPRLQQLLQLPAIVAACAAHSNAPLLLPIAINAGVLPPVDFGPLVVFLRTPGALSIEAVNAGALAAALSVRPEPLDAVLPPNIPATLAELHPLLAAGGIVPRIGAGRQRNHRRGGRREDTRGAPPPPNPGGGGKRSGSAGGWSGAGGGGGGGGGGRKKK